MRILCFFYHYPPYGAIAAVRASKMTKYLCQSGHDVFVITTTRPGHKTKTVPIEIDPERIIRAGRSSDRNTLLDKLTGGYGNRGISWYPYAYRAAASLIENWRPDIIYASAMPYYPLVAAYRVAQKYSIPWVAEFRDLWIDNHYSVRRGLRRLIQERLERKLLLSTVGLVTVSEPLAETLRRKYPKPVRVIMNGFDPADYPVRKESIDVSDSLEIVYTGSMYEGKQDPSPLFKALTLLGNEAERIKVVFYGTEPSIVQNLARSSNVASHVTIKDRVPYKDSLRVQSHADILLLLLWNDPNFPGVYTGKLFEYIGAKRPILAVGPAGGVAATMINERKLGMVTDNPRQIADLLLNWLNQKRAKHLIPAPSEVDIKGLTRDELNRELEAFFVEILGNN